METAAIREVAHGSVLYRLMLDFREAELRHPLGLRLVAADHAGEDKQRHFAAVAEGELAAGQVELEHVAEEGAEPAIRGTVVMKPLPREPGLPSRAKLRQMAVAPACRGRGLGSRLVRFAEAAMGAEGVREVELGAREGAVGFYERLGYAVSGAAFVEIGQPHLPMRRRLPEGPSASAIPSPPAAHAGRRCQARIEDRP